MRALETAQCPIDPGAGPDDPRPDRAAGLPPLRSVAVLIVVGLIALLVQTAAKFWFVTLPLVLVLVALVLVYVPGGASDQLA